jgi:hypothetical protein
MRTTVLCITVAAFAACQPVDRRRAPPQASQGEDTVTPAPPPPPASPRATKVGMVVGFLTPESVLDD